MRHPREVFISHSTGPQGDPRAVDALAAELRRRGVRVLVDRLSLGSGDDWDPEIRGWVARCDAAVVLLSARMAESGYCHLEVGRLVTRQEEDEVILFPVYLGDGVTPEVVAEPDGPWQRWKLFGLPSTQGPAWPVDPDDRLVDDLVTRIVDMVGAGSTLPDLRARALEVSLGDLPRGRLVAIGECVRPDDGHRGPRRVARAYCALPYDSDVVGDAVRHAVRAPGSEVVVETMIDLALMSWLTVERARPVFDETPCGPDDRERQPLRTHADSETSGRALVAAAALLADETDHRFASFVVVTMRDGAEGDDAVAKLVESIDRAIVATTRTDAEEVRDFHRELGMPLVAFVAPGEGLGAETLRAAQRLRPPVTILVVSRLPVLGVPDGGMTEGELAIGLETSLSQRKRTLTTFARAARPRTRT